MRPVQQVLIVTLSGLRREIPTDDVNALRLSRPIRDYLYKKPSLDAPVSQLMVDLRNWYYKLLFGDSVNLRKDITEFIAKDSEATQAKISA